MNFFPIDFGSIDLNRAGFVYLIHAEGTNRYKIGRSKNAITRIADIQRQSPYRLVLVKSFCTPDSISDEKFAHESLKDFRVYGEWFEMPECFDYHILCSFFWSEICFRIMRGADKLLVDAGINLEDPLFKKKIMAFADQTILVADNLDQFYYFDAFIKHLVKQIKADMTGNNSNLITNYASGLISGACLSHSFKSTNKSHLPFCKWQPNWD